MRPSHGRERGREGFGTGRNRLFRDGHLHVGLGPGHGFGRDAGAVVLHPGTAGVELAARRAGQKRRHLGRQGDAVMRRTFGEKYDRLVALKSKYDPINLFSQNSNIKPQG